MTTDIHQWPDSLWKSTAEPANELPPLIENTDTDLLVIGAGYTGLSTALHCQKNVQDVIVIDQVQPGWGCSGRNGGQINAQWKSSIAHLRQHYSETQFDDFIKLIYDSTDIVFDLVEQYAIRCRLQKSGALIPAKGLESVGYLQEWSAFWQSYGARSELLDSSQTKKTIGTDAYDAAMLNRDGGSLQPLSFTRGLVRACLQEGVRVYGDTRAIKIANKDKRWVVDTQHGRISCKSLVIGTNGYTDGVWPGLSQSLIPVASMISATEPLSATEVRNILPGKQCVAEYAGLPYYYRLDENNRLVMGGRGTRYGGMGSLDTSHLRKATVKLFPALQRTRWEYDWAGYVGVTHHQRPMLIRLGDNAYAGLGYNGRGITMATAMGKQLANVVTGEPILLPVDALHRIPMHQFHRAGVAWRILYGQRKDRQNGLR